MNEELNQKKIDKEFWLTTISLNNRTTVYVLTVLIVAIGIGSYISLPKELFPEVSQPIVYIGTNHPGNSPVDIENLITRPIEKELNTISEVDNIKSTSVQDHSTIIVEFTTDTDIEQALTKAKDAVDRAKPDLPSDLRTDPNVFEMNMSEFPIMNINISGNYSVEELKEYAEYLEDEIEKLPEISKVEIRGIDEKEVRINADPYAMEARTVSFTDIENAVAAENITMSGGNILSNGMRRSIRILGEFNSPYQLSEIVVKHEHNNIVYLKDIATIEFDYKERESYARLYGQPVLMVDVIKRSGENLLIVTEKINNVLEKAKQNVFPSDLNIVITNDQSKRTLKMVSNLENNIIFGIILVVLTLLFFLGTRNAIFVGIAIPLSMFMSFMILGTIGITINMMVLFSLIMALGMLVDNGIVVVENVYRLREAGMSAIEATKKGVGEVAMPIIASTATTLAAFLPLAFWPGIMGEFMKYLPITLIITLGSSLFVALVINPVIISTFMSVGKNKKSNKRKILIWTAVLTFLGLIFIVIGYTYSLRALVFLGNIALLFGILTPLNAFVLEPVSRKFQASFLPYLENQYTRILRIALKGYNTYLFFWGTILLLFSSIGLMIVKKPNVIFMPDNVPKYVNILIEHPVGTDIEVTNEFVEKLESRIFKEMAPYDFMIESIIAKVGKDTSDPNDPSSFGKAETPNQALITINFVEFEYREGQSTRKIMDELRELVMGYPGVTITVDKDNMGPPTGKPINIEVSGEDYVTLIGIVERMKKYINESGIQGIEKLKTDLETGKPELIVEIDREKARRFGLSTYSVANELRTSLFGKEISKFKQGEKDYEIQLRLDKKYRYDLEALMNKSVVFRDQSSGKMHQVPISSVAKAKFSSTFGSVKRKDLKRVITISSNVITGHNATEITGQIKDLLATFEIPPGYEFKFGGEQEQQAEEMAFLSKALGLAIFLIFLIIVSQFNKITTPFIIMASVVLSTIGVFLGLVIFKMDFVVIMTMIGIISLAGIVVNNAIVLIDFIELSRSRLRLKGGGARLSMENVKEAIVEAGKIRLRPVLLTAITTILGLIPLAIGINFDFLNFFSEYDPKFFIGGDNVIFWGPMSWTIIFGLTFATFLTLIIVPVMYLFFAKINRRLGIE